MKALDLTVAGSLIEVELADFLGFRITRTYVLIQLDPEVRQGVRRVVRVGDGFLPINALGLVIQAHVDRIVGLLLVVRVSRGSRSSPVDIGRR